MKGYEIGDIVQQKMVDDPSDNYFSIALKRVSESKSNNKYLDSITLTENIFTACVFSFLSLEASINRLFYESFLRKDPFLKINSSIPSNILNYIKQSWQRMSVKDKFLILPPLISDYQFQQNIAPFNLFSEFVTFRNRLVHPKILECNITIRIDSNELGYGGEILETSTEAPDSKTLFPLTNLSTDFRNISVVDAEKCLDIAYRMRMILYQKMNSPFPTVVIQNSGSQAQIAMGESIEKLITLYFGPI